jgi:polyhydroxybutyrate depolymerase
MHGFTSCASVLERYDGWKEIAEEEGFIMAYPQGTEKLEGQEDDSPSWNAGNTCCGGSTNLNANIDDEGFIGALVESVVASENINASRIYMAGHSNGCAMAQRMAAQRSDMVAGVACHSHYMVDVIADDFSPVPIIEIHGKLDEVVR